MSPAVSSCWVEIRSVCFPSWGHYLIRTLNTVSYTLLSSEIGLQAAGEQHGITLKDVSIIHGVKMTQVNHNFQALYMYIALYCDVNVN